jgi:two-component system cell cycle response regulator CtrA
MTRSQDPAPSSIRTGNLVVDCVAKTATVAGQHVHLGMKEYQVVECLSLHRDTVLTREALLAHLYGTVDQPEIKILDMFIDKLRRKLAHATAHIVETSDAGVMGLRLIAPSAPSA